MEDNKLKKWIRMYGLKNVILRGMYSKFSIIPVSRNKLLRHMNWQLKVKKRLKKYIRIRCQDLELEKRNPYKNTIWFLWFQGVENAPEIVKKCYEITRQYANEIEYQIVVLSEKNMFDYLNIPTNIVKKWENGIISNANFSDICRVQLLAEYGGIWMDATVMLTGNINKEILQSELFFFQASFLDMSVTKISNWFMLSKQAGNAFLLSLKDSLYNYWDRNNCIDDYFIFHLMVAELSETKELKSYFEKVPYFSNTYPHLLGRELNNTYDEDKYNQILKKSNIHKLTYKNLDKQLKSSFYYKIIQGNNKR